jgi:hypothetical protein
MIQPDKTRMKKYAVVFWTQRGSRMLVVIAENKEDACNQVEEIYKGRYCGVMFAQFFDWVK